MGALESWCWLRLPYCGHTRWFGTGLGPEKKVIFPSGNSPSRLNGKRLSAFHQDADTSEYCCGSSSSSLILVVLSKIYMAFSSQVVFFVSCHCKNTF